MAAWTQRRSPSVFEAYIVVGAEVRVYPKACRAMTRLTIARRTSAVYIVEGIWSDMVMVTDEHVVIIDKGGLGVTVLRSFGSFFSNAYLTIRSNLGNYSLSYVINP